jgi:hypothetical protein
MGFFKRLAHQARDFLTRPLLEQSSAPCQLQLALAYRALVQSGSKLPGLRDVGFKVFSQADEDGILLYLFSIIGTRTWKSVEICAGNGIECNTANLIIHHGWSGLLVDGNEALVEQGRKFYRRNRHTYVYPPAFVHSWITRDNVNQVIRSNGFEGEIDLLSLDLDGVDYWIWEAIDVIDPVVVVVEYQDIIGPERALVVPYRDDFRADQSRGPGGGRSDFIGASLPAWVKLARRKGYRLVGCNRYGYNAFFVRSPVAATEIPEVPIMDCFRHPKVLQGMRERFPAVRDLPWVEV